LAHQPTRNRPGKKKGHTEREKHAVLTFFLGRKRLPERTSLETADKSGKFDAEANTTREEADKG